MSLTSTLLTRVSRPLPTKLAWAAGQLHREAPRPVPNTAACAALETESGVSRVKYPADAYART